MSTEEVSRLSPPVGPRDHVEGSAAAPVTLVEYGDFECPHCGRAHPILKEVQRHFGKRLRFVFRHFPITTSHPHAEHAAEAAEAAAAQDHFWEMHDTLFEHQRALDDAHLEKYAQAIGLDVKRFDKEMEDGKHAARVREDFMTGIKSKKSLNVRKASTRLSCGRSSPDDPGSPTKYRGLCATSGCCSRNAARAG